MIFLLLTSLALASETYEGELVKGKPWKVKLRQPQRGELCLTLSPEMAQKKWLVDGLHVEIKGTKKEKCLLVESMLPTTFDPARGLLKSGLKKP